MEQKRTKEKKEAFIEHYRKCDRYIARTCRRIGISRWTFYNWIKTDPAFFEEMKSWEGRGPHYKMMFAEAWAKIRHKGISDLCRQLEISRWTFYNWMKRDPDFWPLVKATYKAEMDFRDQYFRSKYPAWKNLTLQD